MPDKVKMFEEICKSMLNTYVKKNHDYGDSFSESIRKFGPIAAVVRMNDKMNRINNLVTNTTIEVQDETMRDTIHDLATYCVMLLMEMKE